MYRSIFQKLNHVGVLSLCCAVAVLATCPLAATASNGSSVLWVAPARVDAPLESIGLGYAEWLRQQLMGAGLAVAGKLAAESVGTSDLPDFTSRIRTAGSYGADFAMLSRLRFSRGEIEIALTLYSVDAGELIAASRARSPLATLGEACVKSFRDLLDAAGVPGDASGPAPLLDELSVMTRALANRKARELSAAWREVQGRLAPMAMRLREELSAAARNSDTPISDRAAVMAASGDPGTAWRLIQSTVRRETQKPNPDPRILHNLCNSFQPAQKAEYSHTEIFHLLCYLQRRT